MKGTQMTITVVLEQTPNNWGAFTPDDIGCVIACGDTREETLRLFQNALVSHLEAMRQEGRSVPEITGLEIHETVPFHGALAA